MKAETRQTIILGALLLLAGMLWLVSSRSVNAQAGNLTVVTPAQITCDSSAHPFSATSLTARAIQIIPAATGNSAAITIGDSTVSSTHGWPIAGGGAFILPAMPIDARESTQQHFYDLGKVYYYCTTSDTFRWGYVR